MPNRGGNETSVKSQKSKSSASDDREATAIKAAGVALEAIKLASEDVGAKRPMPDTWGEITRED